MCDNVVALSDKISAVVGKVGTLSEIRKACSDVGIVGTLSDSSDFPTSRLSECFRHAGNITSRIEIETKLKNLDIQFAD